MCLNLGCSYHLVFVHVHKSVCININTEQTGLLVGLEPVLESVIVLLLSS